MFEETKKQQLFDNAIYNNKVGLYCRVSSYIQAKEGFSLEEQEERLRALCVYKQYEIIDIYIDAGISAKNTDRPEFQRMIGDVKIGRINRVLAFKLDRITRSIIDLEKLVVDLEEYNCSLECACEEINTSNANGRFFVRMLTILAQLELERTSERTYIGLEGALKAKHIAKAPLGFKKNENKQLEIDEESAPIIRKIFQDYLEGKSSCKIAKEMTEQRIMNKTWKDNTINNILQNRLYIGEYVLHKATPDKENKVLYDMAPQIISRDIFNKAIKQREKNSHNYYVKHQYLFKQKLYCPHCNSMLTTYSGRSRHQETYLYYKCPNCKPYYLSEKELEKQFVNSVFDLFIFFSLINNDFVLLNNKNYFYEIETVKEEIRLLSEKVDNAKHLLLEKKLSVLEMRGIIEKLEITKKEKEMELSDLENKNRDIISIKNQNYIGSKCNHNNYNLKPNIWYSLTAKQKIYLIQKYINNIEIEINNKDIKIKTININEDKISLFKNDFIKDIYTFTKHEDILVSFDFATLYDFYNLKTIEITGVNITNTLNKENGIRKIVYNT